MVPDPLPRGYYRRSPTRIDTDAYITARSPDKQIALPDTLMDILGLYPGAKVDIKIAVDPLGENVIVLNATGGHY